MIRLLVALLVVALVLYALFARQGGDVARGEALYQSQLRQAQEVEEQLQQQLEQRMKQLDATAWQRGGVGEERHAEPGPPPWLEEQKMGPPLPDDSN